MATKTTKERMKLLLDDVLAGRTLDITNPYWSTSLFAALYRRDAFKPTKWNKNNPETDFKFMLHMMKMIGENRIPSSKQRYKIKCVLADIADSLRSDTLKIADKRNQWAAEAAKKASEKPKLRKLSELTEEQQRMIALAKEGKNILVDACIGSGKTTTIQVLCSEPEMRKKKILYLTYNTLLKLDAKQKIQNVNAQVTNYHGYVYGVLVNAGIKCGISDLIQQFNKYHPELPKHFDIIVVDEYQDIEQEIADMLYYIKEQNPGVQIIAVGDMQQKIYDKTSLVVPDFIDDFLDDYEALRFTKCFRLGAEHAAMLGRIWRKDIVGVNPNCTVRHMHIDDVTEFLAQQNPADILCLGKRTGAMSSALNSLEESYPEIFNKNTVYASISDEDRSVVAPSNETAIFTTYDSSKGLERKICVVFDFDEEYWRTRLNMPEQNYSILRNIFCVAASRGKEQIIFADNPKYHRLTEQRIIEDAGKEEEDHFFAHPFPISKAFSFKYKEDVEHCYQMLKIKKLKTKDNSVIEVTGHDALIDLSPCIGIYQQAYYFQNYDIDDAIGFAKAVTTMSYKALREDASLDDKILYLTMLETTYDRYVHQVKTPFVSKQEANQIYDRLGTVFDGKEPVELPCSLSFYDQYDNERHLEGRADVKKNGLIYELKFMSELDHESFLQLALYLIANDETKGILWNVKNNDMYEVKLYKKDRRKFLDAVVKCITKGRVQKFRDKKPKKEVDEETVEVEIRIPDNMKDVIFGTVSEEPEKTAKKEKPPQEDILSEFFSAIFEE